jgi:hypothetical protein
VATDSDVAFASLVLNDAGADKDFRAEGLRDEFLLMLDASTDRIGIGIALPTVKLDVVGKGKYTVEEELADTESSTTLVVSNTLIYSPIGTTTSIGMAGSATGIVNTGINVNAIGVKGTASVGGLQGGGSSIGVYGEATGIYTGYGVYGTADVSLASGYGVYGEAVGTGTNYAIYGYASGGEPNYAGYFSGPVVIEGSVVINESGVDFDTRIEGNTDENLVFVDASEDFVGIGTASPATKLDVNGTITATALSLTNAYNPFDQALNSTDSPAFSYVYVTNWVETPQIHAHAVDLKIDTGVFYETAWIYTNVVNHDDEVLWTKRTWKGDIGVYSNAYIGAYKANASVFYGYYPYYEDGVNAATAYMAIPPTAFDGTYYGGLMFYNEAYSVPFGNIDGSTGKLNWLKDVGVTGALSAGSLSLTTSYNPFDQSLNTTDSPTFGAVTAPTIYVKTPDGNSLPTITSTNDTRIWAVYFGVSGSLYVGTDGAGTSIADNSGALVVTRGTDIITMGTVGEPFKIQGSAAQYVSFYNSTTARVGWFGDGWNNGDMSLMSDAGNCAMRTSKANLEVGVTGTVSIGTIGEAAPVGLFHVFRPSFGIGTVATVATTALVGTGTTFTSTLKVGDTITVAGETIRTIASIADDTNLTVSVAFGTTASGLGYTLSGETRFQVLGNGTVSMGELGEPTNPPRIYSHGFFIHNQYKSAANDFQVLGDTDDALIYADVSADRVGIGTATPTTKLDVVGGINASGEVRGNQPYGEMYVYENVTSTVIDKQNVYHAFIPVITGLVNNFTFTAGIKGTIASIADYSGTVTGAVLITDVAHGLSTDDVITITNTNTYDGAYKITWVDADTFYVIATWAADSTGYWQRGSRLRCGSAGVYKISWNLSGDSVVNGDDFKIEANAGITHLDNIVGERIFSNGADYTPLAANGLVSLAVGDDVWLSLKNKSGAGDFTARHANLNIILVK